MLTAYPLMLTLLKLPKVNFSALSDQITMNS